LEDCPSAAQWRLLSQGEMSFPKHVLQRPMSEIKPFQTENENPIGAGSQKIVWDS
jgi:hypothetical protein